MSSFLIDFLLHLSGDAAGSGDSVGGVAVSGNMSREEAVKLAQAALEAHQIEGSPGLNAQDFGGFDDGSSSTSRIARR
jgi:hypothetical protein